LGWQSEVRFPGDLASGNFALELVHAADLLRIAELVATPISATFASSGPSTPRRSNSPLILALYAN
jgi:hypothetical protein